MASSTSKLIFILLFCIFNPVSANFDVKQIKCYYPNGELSISARPCLSSSDDGHSYCCHPAVTYCVNNGACVDGPGGNFTRESCTDKTWQSRNCPQYCKNTQKDGNVGLVKIIRRVGRSDFCCGHLDSDGNCTTEEGLFKFKEGVRPLVNWHQVELMPDTTSPSTDTPTNSATDIPAAAPNTRREIAIGAGVGVPLGVAFLTTLFLLWKEKRDRKRDLQTPPKLVGSRGMNSNYSPSSMSYYPTNILSPRIEMPTEIHQEPIELENPPSYVNSAFASGK